MVVVARVVVLVADSSNKPGEEASSPVTTAAASAGNGRTEDENVTIEHGDIMQALSGAHLREVGIAIKEARPGWQEAHVQVRGGGGRLCVFFNKVSVYKVLASVCLRPVEQMVPLLL